MQHESNSIDKRCLLMTNLPSVLHTQKVVVTSTPTDIVIEITDSLSTRVVVQY